MVTGIVQNGVIVPRDPLPQDWIEGTIVEVEKSRSNGRTENEVHPTDAWMDEVEASAAQGTLEDDQRLDAAIQAVHRREKERTRKQLGL